MKPGIYGKGKKIHFETYIQNLILGGKSLAKANQFQFYSNPSFSELAGENSIIKFLVTGQSTIVVRLLELYRHESLLYASVYGTIMNDSIVPLVRADYIWLRLPDQADVVIKVDNKDVSLKEMGFE